MNRMKNKFLVVIFLNGIRDLAPLLKPLSTHPMFSIIYIFFVIYILAGLCPKDVVYKENF